MTNETLMLLFCNVYALLNGIAMDVHVYYIYC